MLEDADRRILRHLQADPGQPMSALAEVVRIPQATLARRLDRLRAAGILGGSEVEINWKALGYSASVSLRITLDKTQPRAFDDFIDAARKVPEVLEIQTFLGRVDVRLSLVARDMGHYQTLYRDHILTLPHITDIEALMQVAEVHKSAALPL